MLSWPVFIGVEVLKERNFSVSTVFQHFAGRKFDLVDWVEWFIFAASSAMALHLSPMS